MEKNIQDKKIDIHISKGKLESFTVYVDDENTPNISTTIGLYTEHNQKITTFSVDTRNYYGNSKIDLPIGTIPAIQKIIEELELATIRKCREGQLSLSANNDF
jgi:hypothetical protein